MMRKRKIIGIIGLVLILVIVLFYVVRIQPMVKEYKKIAYDKLANIDEDTFAKLENTKVYGKNGELIGEVNSGSYQYKKISEISKYVQDGYIAVEDKNFKSHHGIDYLATVRAGIKLVLNRGKATQGGSTITQQLVKNSFLSQEKTFTRKIAEFFLAPEIEKMYTKPQIMEYYCNSNYYGNRCYGIGNAASYYFHKNADQLTLSEAALLVGLSNNPSRYDPVTNYNSSIRKRDRVLKHMLDAKVISKTQYQQAKNEKIEIAEYRKNVKPEGYQTSFAIYQATLELMKKNGFEFQYTFQDKEDEKQYKERYQEEYQKYFQKLRNGGYKLYTSFDQECQKALQSSVDHNLRSFTKKKKGKYELQGAAVSIDLEEQKKWKDAMETYVTQKEQQRIAENEKAEKEAVQKRQVYEQQQNIKLVESYISRLDVMDTYDDTAEDIITKLQEALKKCEDYDTYDELNQKAEQAIERVRNLNSDTTTTESN